MYKQFDNGEKLRQLVKEVEVQINEIQQQIESTVEDNQFKILQSFRSHQISDFHFTPSTGYGYDDVGREKLEAIYADVFGGESAIVRPQIISGTHAIATCLFGILHPGDELLYVTGQPYDTLEEVIGLRGSGNGSLMQYGIGYGCAELTDDGEVDYDEVKNKIKSNTKVVGIQRSKGYAKRPSFTINKLKKIIDFVKEIKSDLIVFVDNCYGEFVETMEPCHVGADLIAGSLIKNPGGGIVKTGGYIVGNRELVDLASYRLTAPGIGKKGGASLYSLQEMYQGFFLAPHIVGQALRGAVFTAAFFEKLQFKSNPKWDSKRTDLIQSVQFDDAETMITFCQGIQLAAPINAHVTPYPSSMPGYKDEVIMAAGTFIQGASIELSADGPIRSPYTAYIQGGLTYSHVKIGILTAVDHLVKKGLLKL